MKDMNSIREKIYKLHQEIRRNPEVVQASERLYRERGVLSEEDLQKRCDI